MQCLKCKGRGFCGRISCPLLSQSNARNKVTPLLNNMKDSFVSQSPAPFIGRVGYPNINVGILAPPEKKEDIAEYDDPKRWAKENYQIPSIMDLRTSLINSRSIVGVLEKNKIVSIVQEIGMASEPVDIELKLKKKPTYSVSYDPASAPMGPQAELTEGYIGSNPKVARPVEKAVSDTDLKAGEAVNSLYKKGFDENFLSRLLSVGTLGIQKKRKLVPTRWSITAVDDLLANNMLDTIKSYPNFDYRAYFGGYLGNYYLILMFEEPWCYELFETYLPKASWNQSPDMQFTTDYEPYDGRKTYAENCAGGFYAARLAILEHLRDKKQQGTALTIRFITGEYTNPLGVWVCREACRKALNTQPICFSDRNLMLTYARSLAKKKFSCDLDLMIKQSIVIKNITSQSRLTSFFK